ncbi:MAG: phosphodiester glycosidase family protein, partial [Candidatus Marinimicrobia bacterium]|nr:phosphodiester glycosidase family protein [Candidatus Neomarinimicrobiota bacterium]
ELSRDTIHVSQVISHTLFNSQQKISILSLNKKFLNEIKIDIAYVSDTLVVTSNIAKKNHALAAINGGFFDMEKGGSVSYFEKNDTVISRTHSSEQKWGKPNNLINGALIITKGNDLLIDIAKREENVYEKSNEEAFVLVTGPLLIRDSKLEKLNDKMSFFTKRHPRSCVCSTKDSILLIAIDGRNKNAAGMSLFELQKYLLSLGCIDAINLDGGGSTTLWTKKLGIVNQPSDRSGERPVSNAIILIRNK